MKTAIILFCVFGIALCVPVTKLEPQPTAELPSPIPAATTGQVEVARRRRQLFGLDYNVYNNNGFGYFDNGYGGYGGYPGYGGFGGGYGGYGGYPGYGGFGGYPGFGGFGGFF